MGYSGRYHAASLAAVFVALAIGILIGIGLADDVVSGAKGELEDSLRSDLDEANGKVDDLTADLGQERQFSERAAAALVSDRLLRQQVALIELGEAPGDTVDSAVDAIDSAGGNLASRATIALPPDVDALAEAAGGSFAKARPGRARTVALGTAVGRQLVGGGPLVERIREQLFERLNGDLTGVTRDVLLSRPPDDLEADLNGQSRAFVSAMLHAIDARADGTVGAEETSTDPTTLAVFSNAGIATVDNLESTAGQVSAVAALLGAEGDFGVKDGATSLMPDLTDLSTAPDKAAQTAP
jgi:hypothetical protein